jgi:HK97 gp10 family phage protein
MATRNAAGLVANLYAMRDEIADDARELVAETGAREYQRAYDLAPKDTGFMAEQLRLEFSEQGYTYELGYHEADFTAAGFAFYPLYQEFGTSTMAAQPSLFPARAEIRPEFQRDLRALLRNAARNVKRRPGARRTA